MKKFGLFLLSLLAILFIGIAFANPITPDTYYICSMFENVEIDNYRVIVQNGSSFYEPTEYSCSQCGQRQRETCDGTLCYESFPFSGPVQKVFLLEKSASVEDITEGNVESRAISVGSITSTYCDRGTNKTRVYKIVSTGNSYTMLDRTERYKIRQEIKGRLKDFPLYWSLAIVIESLVLFFIAKLFRKEDQISNKKLLFWGVIPTTITLPLLWFVLPLLLGNGTLYIIIGELLVAVLEAIMIKYGLNISRKRAIITSVICNIFSFMILPNNLRDNPIGVALFWLFGIVLIGIILFIIGKLSKEGISNKKLVLCGFLTPIVDFLVVWVVSGIFDAELPIVITLILVDMLIIKRLRKISRKKCIILSIFFNLCIGAIIILALIYFFDL